MDRIEIIDIEKRLSDKFNGFVEFIGFERFLLRKSNTITVNPAVTYEYILLDKMGNIIPTKNKYDGITSFIKGISVVCVIKSQEIDFNRGRYTQEKVYGIIDINGKEILPCIFTKIKLSSDGNVELIKEEKSMITTIPDLLMGKFEY